MEFLMTFSVNIAPLSIPKSGRVAFFVAQGGVLKGAAQTLDKSLSGALKRAMKIQGFSGEKGKTLGLIAPGNSKYDRVILVGLGKAADLKNTDLETIGGNLVTAAGEGQTVAVLDVSTGKVSSDEAAARLALGARLAAYRFDQYKSKATKKKVKPAKLTISTEAVTSARKLNSEYTSLSEGISLARDLVNEPANILTPPEFARRAKALSKLGVKVEVLSEAQMKRLGMGALLGVGQGSAQPSQLVVMQYMGGAKSQKPLAFVGKGVCFDTGGISIKPAGGMEDMKGDMGGAAAVTGLLHSLAKRKAKANVVGVIGLVENMPSSTAQRPGDIVTSMSGQTIEVLNTDAEGRLVLADAIWYTQNRFKPQFIIDLATLTGAILVALGQDYAGLFSNSDDLSKKLETIGEAEGERVWRMPINDNFDKMINTPNADMKNIGGRYAGSSTAAQFLQRFANKVPWVHLDIAGTAMGSPKSAISKSWASGYGVKLLDRLVKKHYE
jgi:leucyl aminopeptidase